MNENEIPIKYIYYSKKFEQALFIFVDNIEVEKGRMYDLLKPLLNRRDVINILEGILYVQELRLIFLDRHTKDN